MAVPASTHQSASEIAHEQEAVYRMVDHEPEGRTDSVSAMRGHPVRDATKCMVGMIKIGKKITRFVLAVMPGDRRVDIRAVQALFNGTFARFAEASVAERLSGSVSGTILPFSFVDKLQVVVDPELFRSCLPLCDPPRRQV
jgi:Ala-tRNA(Pro) deacylase